MKSKKSQVKKVAFNLSISKNLPILKDLLTTSSFFSLSKLALSTSDMLWNTSSDSAMFKIDYVEQVKA